MTQDQVYKLHIRFILTVSRIFLSEDSDSDKVLSTMAALRQLNDEQLRYINENVNSNLGGKATGEHYPR